MSPTQTASRTEVAPRLHALASERLPFAPALAIRAFLLERERGNVLIYSSRGLADEADELERRGGASRRYLNHWHEAMFASELPGTPLFVHEHDRPRVAEDVDVRGAFSRRHMLDDDLEVIPTPGHTEGATAYLWDSGSERILFTGDTVYLREGEWVAAVLASSDRDAYLRSLELIRGLEFDLLAPWAGTAGEPPVSVTDGADARRRLDAIIERVRSGSDH